MTRPTKPEHRRRRGSRWYTIPPGHDAWVEGNQPFVAIEVMSAEIYAKPV
jgi:hypothetical protein